jgi:lysine 2,3-aminomutase
MSSIRSVKALQAQGLVSADQVPELQQVEAQFATAITPEMLAHIEEPGIAKQFLPSVQELQIQPEELQDPIGDAAHSPVKGIVHRHRDRCLLMPVKVCAVYCRFCFRRELIGPGTGALTPNEMAAALDYIRQKTQIWEVILTGGDPLMLKPKLLSRYLQELAAIEHVEVIRLHTRIPMVDSQRINADLLAVLSRVKPIYVVLHINHVDEFHPEAIAACERLIQAGCVLLCQSVLLKGINDSVGQLAALYRACVKYRIKPYYLHQLDQAKGTSHFRVPIDEGRALMHELRANYSGLCLPTYVIDVPEGKGGKTPL